MSRNAEKRLVFDVPHNILAIFEPVVGDFCESFSNKGFFDSLVGHFLRVQKGKIIVVIKAICFDADGVIINPQMLFSKHLEKEHGISPEMMQSFYRGVFNDCLVGKAKLEDVLPAFLTDWGWKDTTREFINTWLITEDVVDIRVTNVVQYLRHNGVVCCLTTSQEHNRAEYMKAKMGFEDIFDHLFFSCELGLQKPHHSYYQHIEKTLGLEKNAILFWDDSRKNVESAREFGWNAEIYTDFNEFAETIKKYVFVEKRT